MYILLIWFGPFLIASEAMISLQTAPEVRSDLTFEISDLHIYVNIAYVWPHFVAS